MITVTISFSSCHGDGLRNVCVDGLSPPPRQPVPHKPRLFVAWASICYPLPPGAWLACHRGPDQLQVTPNVVAWDTALCFMLVDSVGQEFGMSTSPL